MVAEEGQHADRVGDDEIVFRRVPFDSYDGGEHAPAIEAFRPHRDNDVDGLSFFRLTTQSHESAAPPSGKRYWVVEYRAGDLRAAGLEIVPAPTAQHPGHAVIPSLNSRDRKSAGVMEAARALSAYLGRGRPLGPFTPPPLVAPPPAPEPA